MLITAHPNLFDFPVVIAYTEGMPIEEWRKMRKDYIGGSEAYPCLGIGGKYNSRIGVYYDKTSDIMEQSDSERMWAGRMLEPVIAQMFAERSGKTVVKQPYMFRHPDYDFMMANIDFGILGENAGLECKNSAARKLWENGVPESYMMQVQHYMAVTNMDRWYIAFLLDGWEFNYVCIERDDALIDLLIQKEWELWYHHIIPRIPPEYDGSDNAKRVLEALYPNEKQGESIDLDVEIDIWMERADTLDARLKELEYERKGILNNICGLIGECEIAYTPSHIFKYKTIAPKDKKAYRRLFITSRKEG